MTEQVTREAGMLREAYQAAEIYARACVAGGDGFVSPKAQVGSLSPFEWQKLVNAAVSGWIIERVAQASREQIHHDNMIFVTGGHPPVREVGKMAALLPVLGHFVEERGLSEKPVGEWARDDVLTFAWLSWKNGGVAEQHFSEMDQDIPFEVPAVEENWKPVPSLPGLLASDLGRIMIEPYEGPAPKGGVRLYGGKARLGSWDGTRYVIRWKKAKMTYRVARLVCEAFHGSSPFRGAVVMHLNENSRDNRPKNLAWGSQKENLNAPGFLAYCRARTGENSPIAKHRAKREVWA